MSLACMAEHDAFRKARMELEALYEGVPDDSVNLTFRHLTDGPPDSSVEKEKVKPSTPKDDDRNTPMSKLPSLDFNRGLQAANQHYPKIRLHPSAQVQVAGVRGVPPVPAQVPVPVVSDYSRSQRVVVETGVAYNDDLSRNSVSPMHQRLGTAAGRRRSGIPHSNICTICTTYIYIFRHRCLVCGRVYCRQCVNIGMGEMTEGRKCLECLGKRFSHRYIAKAGDVGCCGWRYPRMVKQAELKWAEKGPRRKADRGGGYGGRNVSTTSESRPWPATAPAHVDAFSTISSPGFAVMSSPAFSPAHRHHIPF